MSFVVCTLGTDTGTDSVTQSASMLFYCSLIRGIQDAAADCVFL